MTTKEPGELVGVEAGVVAEQFGRPGGRRVETVHDERGRPGGGEPDQHPARRCPAVVVTTTMG